MSLSVCEIIYILKNDEYIINKAFIILFKKKKAFIIVANEDYQEFNVIFIFIRVEWSSILYYYYLI